MITILNQISMNFEVPFWGLVTYFVTFILAVANMWAEMKVLKSEVKNIKEILQGKK